MCVLALRGKIEEFSGESQQLQKRTYITAILGEAQNSGKIEEFSEESQQLQKRTYITAIVGEAQNSGFFR